MRAGRVVTVLAWVAAYLAASVVTAALLAAAIRHGEEQARAERAQLLRTQKNR